MNLRQRYDLVLSVSLTIRGFAFILFEGPHTPVDWGIHDARGSKKNANCLSGIAALIQRNRPDLLILENVEHPSSHRSARVRSLSKDLRIFVEEYGLPAMLISRGDIRDAFASQNAQTKDEIAEVIAEELPVLVRYLPPTRKPWMSEDARMGLFDAAAMYLTLALRPPNSP
ncbi:MAG: hypothetical protein HYX36_15510 [Rhizobiales bacterium]|nr:hypothetical protein [Hyphomicrobiales bacterium]